MANYMHDIDALNAFNDKMTQLIQIMEAAGGDEGGPIITARNFVSISGEFGDPVGDPALPPAIQLVAGDSGFVFIELFNPKDNTASIYFNDTGVAASGDPNADTELVPGAGYIWSVRGAVPPPVDAISIFCFEPAVPYRAKRA